MNVAAHIVRTLLIALVVPVIGLAVMSGYVLPRQALMIEGGVFVAGLLLRRPARAANSRPTGPETAVGPLVALAGAAGVAWVIIARAQVLFGCAATQSPERALSGSVAPASCVQHAEALHATMYLPAGAWVAATLAFALTLRGSHHRMHALIAAAACCFAFWAATVKLNDGRNVDMASCEIRSVHAIVDVVYRGGDPEKIVVCSQRGGSIKEVKFTDLARKALRHVAAEAAAGGSAGAR